MEILMKPKILATSAIAVVMLAAGTLTVAAEKGPSDKPPMGMQGTDGMKMDGGMMEMMSACGRMMQGESTGHARAQLPPEMKSFSCRFMPRSIKHVARA